MTGNEILSELLDLPGMQVSDYELQGRDGIIVRVESVSPAAICPHCQSLSTECRNFNEAVKVRDLAIWQRRCWLEYRPQRLYCTKCCKLFNERVVWRTVDYSYTHRYEQYIYERTQRESQASVARDEGASEEIVRGIFERWAKKQLPNGGTLQLKSSVATKLPHTKDMDAIVS